MDNKGQHIIKALQKKWQLQSLIAYVLICLSFTAFISVVAYKFYHLSPLVLILFIMLVTTVSAIINRRWMVSLLDVTAYLNRNFSSLEESTLLVFKPAESLTLLENLQLYKVDAALQVIKDPHPFRKKINRAFVICFVSILGSLLISQLNFNTNANDKNSNQTIIVKKEKTLPAIASLSVKIIPPAYTGRSTKQQSVFNIKAEENSTVYWQLKTNIPVKKVQFIFNDSATITLQSSANNTVFQLQKTINCSGFYQVRTNDQLSELYQTEVIKDLPPIITIKTPQPNTVIDFGQPKRTTLNAALTDDYGIKDAFISATIASGSGESVNFKEQKIPLTISFQQHALAYQLQQSLDLAKLQMKPGDELYFYITATDTYQQQTRSDIYIVTLPDTAQLMDFEGLVNNVNFKPEFFRSERQIIIDAEQLLKDKDTISLETFNDRSNNLGMDQKLLRLRYGKFLGKENESNMGIEEPENMDATDFGDASQMIDAFTDKHDNAEDATFLDAPTKLRLKAVLNEMWKAELQLRSYKPQAALPFAYKALKLLKDLQQQSRAYVAKASFKTTPLKPEKRLTGDLSKIIPPLTQQQIIIKTAQDELFKNAIAVMEEMKYNTPASTGSTGVLSQAAQQLSSKAASQPTVYLSAYEAIKRIIISAQQTKKSFVKNDIEVVQKALQNMIQYPTVLPQQNKTGNIKLADQYFINLHKNQQQ